MAFTQADLEAAVRKKDLRGLFQREIDNGFMSGRSLPDNYEVRNGRVEVKPDTWMEKYGWLLAAAPMALAVLPAAAGAAASGGAAGSSALTAPLAGLPLYSASGAVIPTAAGVAGAGTAASTATTAARAGAGMPGGVSWLDIFRVGGDFGSQLWGAHKTSQAADRSAQIMADAQRYIAELTGKANADALAFQKDLAGNAFDNTEVGRRMDYGQWAAKEGRLGYLGDLMGLPKREIPAFIPGVNPNFGGGAPTASARGEVPAAPQGNWTDPAFVAQAMKQANQLAYGYDKHVDPSYWLRPELKGDGDYIWRRMLGEGAGGSDVARMGPYAGVSAAPAPSGGLFSPYVPTRTSAPPALLNTVRPMDLRFPTTLGSYF